MSDTKRVKKLNTLVEGKFLSFYDLEYVDKNNKEKHWSFVTRKKQNDLNEYFFNGKEDKVDAVAIVAYHKDYDKLVVIKQFRVPLNDYIYELPAGLVDDGEDIFETVKRELKEETGLNVISINKKLSKEKMYLSPGMTDESIALVYCLCDGEISEEFLEESEDIKTLLVSKEEIQQIIDSNEKIDIKALLMLQNFLLLGGKMFTE